MFSVHLCQDWFSFWIICGLMTCVPGKTKYKVRNRLTIVFSRNVILCGWLGSKYQPTNWLTHSLLRTFDFLKTFVNKLCQWYSASLFHLSSLPTVSDILRHCSRGPCEVRGDGAHWRRGRSWHRCQHVHQHLRCQRRHGKASPQAATQESIWAGPGGQIYVGGCGSRSVSMWPCVVTSSLWPCVTFSLWACVVTFTVSLCDGLVAVTLTLSL